MPPRVEAGRGASRSGAGGLRMDQLGEPPEVVARRVRKDSVAEVEDVPWPPTRLGEDLVCLTRDHIEGREHHPGVEVALDAAVADPPPRLVERQPPVDADDVGAAPCHGLEQMRGGGPEVDGWYAGLGYGLEDPAAVGHHHRLVGGD